MVTTERCHLDLDQEPTRVGQPTGRMQHNFPAERYRGKSVFRMHAHIVPDQQHQYFKLVEQR